MAEIKQIDIIVIQFDAVFDRFSAWLLPPICCQISKLCR